MRNIHFSRIFWSLHRPLWIEIKLLYMKYKIHLIPLIQIIVLLSVKVCRHGSLRNSKCGSLKNKNQHRIWVSSDSFHKHLIPVSLFQWHFYLPTVVSKIYHDLQLNYSFGIFSGCTNRCAWAVLQYGWCHLLLFALDMTRNDKEIKWL